MESDNRKEKNKNADKALAQLKELENEIKFFLIYVRDTRRTWADKGRKINTQHALLGIITEIGELADNTKKQLGYGKSIDIVNVKEEVGDVMFYIARLIDDLIIKSEEPFLFDDLSDEFLNADANVIAKRVYECIDPFLSECIIFVASILKFPHDSKDVNSEEYSVLGSTFTLIVAGAKLLESLNGKNGDELLNSFKTIVYFLNHFCNLFLISFDDALVTNINKLKVRYPEKFEETKALNRNIEEELKILSKDDGNEQQ